MELSRQDAAGELIDAFLVLDGLQESTKTLVRAAEDTDGRAKELSAQIDLPSLVAHHNTEADNFLSSNLESIQKVGRTLGDITAIQAAYRDLEPGETRQQLVGKVAAGIPQKKWMSLSPCVDAKVQLLLPTAKQRPEAPPAAVD